MDIKVDIDTEKVLIEDEWYSVKELQKKIKDKVDGGDFDVANLSAALKELQESLADVEEFTIKLPSDIAEKVNSGANEQDVTVGTVIRNILSKHFNGGAEEEPAPVEDDSFEIQEEEGLSESSEDNAEEDEIPPADEEEEDENEPEDEEDEGDEYKPVKVECPRCHTTIVVDNPERPLTIVCPNCGNRGRITK